MGIGKDLDTRQSYFCSYYANSNHRWGKVEQSFETTSRQCLTTPSCTETRSTANGLARSFLLSLARRVRVCVSYPLKCCTKVNSKWHREISSHTTTDGLRGEGERRLGEGVTRRQLGRGVRGGVEEGGRGSGGERGGGGDRWT